jgi:hypothetical protein
MATHEPEAATAVAAPDSSFMTSGVLQTKNGCQSIAHLKLRRCDAPRSRSIDCRESYLAAQESKSHVMHFIISGTNRANSCIVLASFKQRDMLGCARPQSRCRALLLLLPLPLGTSGWEVGGYTILNGVSTKER